MLPDRICRIAALVFNLRAIRAFFCWPHFSVTSYLMVSNFERQGLRPKTVIDVGANVGQFAIACAKIFPGAQVHAFEPNPEAIIKLKRNTSSLSNVNVYSKALGEEVTELHLNINAHNHSSSLLKLADSHRNAFPSANEVGSVKVEVSTIDEIFKGKSLISPVLLKLDVQGYEAKVLRGSGQILNQTDYVVIETSFKLLYEGEIIFLEMVQLMESHGFHFSRPVGWLSHPRTGEILQMDALFTRV